MYICLCKAVTDHDIEAAVIAGASTMLEVQEALEVGTGCGSCAGAAQVVIDQTLARAASSHAQYRCQWFTVGRTIQKRHRRSRLRGLTKYSCQLTSYGAQSSQSASFNFYKANIYCRPLRTRCGIGVIVSIQPTSAMFASVNERRRVCPQHRP